MIYYLAFSGPLADSTLETTYLCSKYTDVEIIDCSKLQERGQKVTNEFNRYSPNTLATSKQVTFAESVKEISLKNGI